MQSQNATLWVGMLVILISACGGSRSRIRLPDQDLSVRHTNPSEQDSYASRDAELEAAKAELEAARKKLSELEAAQKSGSADPAELAKLEAQVKEANDKIAAAETEMKKKDAESRRAMDKLKNDLIGFSIQYKHSGKCLDVEGGSLNDGARLRQMPCNMSNLQKFRLIERVNGNWIQNLASGKCLAADANGTQNGTFIIQTSCVDNGSMLHTIQSDGAGFFFMRNMGSNRCVDIEAISLSDGAGAQIYDCVNGDAQRVKFLQTSP
jgi:hypothetical protein